MIIELKPAYRIKRFHGDGTIDYFAGMENYEFVFSEKRDSYSFSSAQAAQDILIKLRKREMQKAKFRQRYLYEFESALTRGKSYETKLVTSAEGVS